MMRAAQGVREGDASKSIPFMISQQHESADRWRDTKEAVAAQRQVFRQQHPSMPFPDEARYQRLNSIEG